MNLQPAVGRGQCFKFSAFWLQSRQINEQINAKFSYFRPKQNFVDFLCCLDGFQCSLNWLHSNVGQCSSAIIQNALWFWYAIAKIMEEQELLRGELAGKFENYLNSKILEQMFRFKSYLWTFFLWHVSFSHDDLNNFFFAVNRKCNKRSQRFQSTNCSSQAWARRRSRTPN